MEVFGIGMSELVFIIIIALIVLGPKDMQKAGKTIGKWLRNIVTSDGWKAFQMTSRELRTLPNKLMREANEELNKIGDEVRGSDAARIGHVSLNAPARSKPTSSSAPAPATPPIEQDEVKAPPAREESNTDRPEPNA